MECPAVGALDRVRSMDVCGSKGNVIVSMRVQYELLAVHFLMNAQQKIESMHWIR